MSKPKVTKEAFFASLPALKIKAIKDKEEKKNRLPTGEL